MKTCIISLPNSLCSVSMAFGTSGDLSPVLKTLFPVNKRASSHKLL